MHFVEFRNVHYLILMKQPQNLRQIFTLARRVSPHRPNYIIDAFLEATSTPYSYLLCDYVRMISFFSKQLILILF